MKIGIETSILAIDKAGPAVYTRQLIEHLKIIDTNNSYAYFNYWQKGKNKGLLASKIRNMYLDLLWLPRILPDELKKNKVDILHCPAFKAPLRCDMPIVVTFYDMHILKMPQDYDTWWSLYCKFMLPKIAMAASKIITISEFSKKDIVEILSIPAEKVVVTYCGASNKFNVVQDWQIKERIRREYKLENNFILYVGALQPRKNIPSLLKAYSCLKKNGHFDLDLVLVSSSGWRNKEIFDLINTLGIGGRVKFLKNIAEDDLAVIYNLADFFVYPSFFEGFGMPVLESMRCGCPVICSKAASLPEVIGDAGIMFNPADTAELESVMRMLAKDSKLKEEMSRKGLNKAEAFSWENCARRTLEVYEEAVNSPNR